jgi:ribosomal protein L3
MGINASTSGRNINIYSIYNEFYLQIIRINVDEQVLYVRGNTPGEIGEMMLLKDSMVPDAKKRVQVV